MENNYKTLRMPELKALARERKLRGYSRLRKAELIAFLQDEDRRQEEPPTQEPELEVPQPLAAGAHSKFFGGGGRVGGLHMCHPPYHPP